MKDLYYKNSGSFSLPKLFLFAISSVILSSIIAFIYALIARYNPFVYLQFIATLGLAVIPGMVNCQLLLIAKVRNKAISVSYGLIVGFITLYFSWSFWVYVILNYKYSLDIILLSPIGMLETIKEINIIGVKSISNFKLNGLLLWAIWLIESIIIVGGIAYYSIADQIVRVFCENCKIWCQVAKTFELENKVELKNLERVLEAKNFSYLKSFFPKSPKSSSWLRLYIRKCPSCTNTNTLTVSQISVKADSEGNPTEVDKELINHLLISTQDIEQVENIYQESIKQA